jgi:adenosylcobinamide kinase / adenosylcobinamide-phosphate guanylyltransferase
VMMLAPRSAGERSEPAGFPVLPFPLQQKLASAELGGALTSSMVSLVIGGARSGKSRFAQSLGTGAQRALYIATARAEDAEMEARIAEHRRMRPADWCTVEAPVEIAEAVERHRSQCDFLLLDCLTVWLSNFCWEHREKAEHDIETDSLTEIARVAGAAAEAHVVLVSNEVGCGLVPESPLGRFFRDLQGRVNQEAARLADQVFHVVAGIAVPIKRPEMSPRWSRA